MNELKSNLSKLEAEYEINCAQIDSLESYYINLNEDHSTIIKNIEEIKDLDNQETDFQIEEENINIKKKALEDFRNKNLDSRLVLEELMSQFNFCKNRLMQIDKELQDWSIRKKDQLINRIIFY